MKLTWKNSKRRPPAVVSSNLNLPFDQGEHGRSSPEGATHVFGDTRSSKREIETQSSAVTSDVNDTKLACAFQEFGNKLAEEGDYGEALVKWEAALAIKPGMAVLHEQKAQVLLEIGDAWKALKAATCRSSFIFLYTYHRANNCGIHLILKDHVVEEVHFRGATELEPSWAEAWITLGRAQLNFGEPDCAVTSFDRALAIKPDCEEAKADRHAALHLVKKRKQLHLSGLSANENRYVVAGKDSSE